MKTIRFIHWNKEEAEQRAKLIQSPGYRITWQVPAGGKAMRELFDNPPNAFVIDLSRLPAQGRDLGLILRKTRSTRYVPLIYVSGDSQKVKNIKKVLPDAVYTEWDSINHAIKQALRHVPVDPLVPRSLFDVYAGKPLIKKLGIKSKMTVSLLQAPPGFERTLGRLPPGTTLCRDVITSCDLILCFVTGSRELRGRLTQLSARDDYKSVWIIWPKKGGSIVTDLTQQTVRRNGLANGLVDYKICSVDPNWSGLLFTRRKNNSR